MLPSSEAFQLEAYQALPEVPSSEAYQVLPEAYQVLPSSEAYQLEAFHQVLPEEVSSEAYQLEAFHQVHQAFQDSFPYSSHSTQ